MSMANSCIVHGTGCRRAMQVSRESGVCGTDAENCFTSAGVAVLVGEFGVEDMLAFQMALSRASSSSMLSLESSCAPRSSVDAALVELHAKLAVPAWSVKAPSLAS